MDRGVWHLLTGLPYPIRLAGYGLSPKNPVIGSDLAGVVEAVGMSRFRPGDEVFGIGKVPSPTTHARPRTSLRTSRRTSPSSRRRSSPSPARSPCKPYATTDGSSRGRKCWS